MQTDLSPPYSRLGGGRGANLTDQTCGHFSDWGLPSVSCGSKCQAGGKLRAMCQLSSWGSAWEGGLGRIIPVFVIELGFSFWGKEEDIGCSWIHLSPASHMVCQDRQRLLLWKCEESARTEKLVMFDTSW